MSKPQQSPKRFKVTFQKQNNQLVRKERKYFSDHIPMPKIA